MPDGPLEGLRVLDLTRLLPGGYATMLLGDLGADVVKVEEPGLGDHLRWAPPMAGEHSAAHLALNRNKRSVTLNLRRPEGAALLLRLARGADVLVESFRPGVMDRLGVGHARLRQENPALVCAAITGYGQNGPYRDRPGHDINYIALAGVLGGTGPPGGPPALPAVQLADLSGAMMAVVGILAALWRRERSGRGDTVDASMTDAALSWTVLQASAWAAGEPEPGPGEGLLTGGNPSYRVYECSDGRYVAVGALEPKFWSTLCEALGHPELAGEQFAGGRRRREVREILERTFRSRSRDEWLADLTALDACVTSVNGVAEAFSDPHAEARGMVVERDLPGGIRWRELGVPLRLIEHPASLRRSAPGLGEHNAEVYGELGLGRPELANLAAGGVI